MAIQQVTGTDRARWIPEGALKVADKKSDAVVYLFERNGHLCGVAYHGKAGKSDWHFRFRNAAERERKVMAHFAWRQRHANYKAERKAEAKALRNKLQVGHILVSSWGYEQTNVDWYEVVALVGSTMAELRKIRGNRTEHQANDAGQCVPMAGEFIGQPFRVRVTGDRVKVGHHSARLWEGKPVYWSAYH